MMMTQKNMDIQDLKIGVGRGAKKRNIFHIRTVQLDIKEDFYSPNNVHNICLKNNTKIYIKTAPTYFGVPKPSSGSALIVLAKVTLIK
jgi:hypothetical protein